MSPVSAMPHPSDISAYRHEWPVLLECASPRCDVLKLSKLIQGADWPRLLLLAGEHGVVGHLVASSRMFGSALIPPEIERRIIIDMLERTGWNQTEAAERFMIPLSTLNQKIKRLGIDVRRRGRSDETFTAATGK